MTQAARRSLKDAAAAHGLKEPVIPENAESLWALLAGTELWSDDLLLLTPVLVFDQFEEVVHAAGRGLPPQLRIEIGELSGSRAHIARRPRRPGIQAA